MTDVTPVFARPWVWLLAARELRHNRASSVLTIVLVALAVLGIVVPSVLLRTAGVGTKDRISRGVGQADYRVDLTLPAAARDGVPSVAGPGQVAFISTAGRVLTADGAVVARLTTLAYGHPLARGLLLPRSGRPPVSATEAAVTPELARRLATGEGGRLRLETGAVYDIVGTYLDPGSTAALGVVLPSGTRLPGYSVAQVSVLGTGDPTGQQARVDREGRAGGAATAGGATLTTRADATRQGGGTLAETQRALLTIIVSLGLLQFGLLISATMAIATARQRRVLALLAATGGAPRHLRGTVLAHGMLVGLVGGTFGLIAGVAVARVAAPPFLAIKQLLFVGLVLRPMDLLAAALLGAATTVLSAFPPSRVAGRVPPLAVLGRVDQDPARLTVPRPRLAIGLLLLGSGGILAGAGRDRIGIAPTLASTVLVGAGLLALVPMTLRGLGRLAADAPVPVRLAVRDTERHQTRCLPAVAVITAAAAATVAVTTFIYSDTTAAERAYVPPYRADELHIETASLADHDVPASLLEQLGHVVPLRGSAPISYAGTASVQSPGWYSGGLFVLVSANSPQSTRRPGPPAPVAVGGPDLAGLLGGPAARAANNRGEAVAFAPYLVDGDATTLTVSGNAGTRAATLHVRVIARRGPLGAAGVLLPASLASRLALPVTDSGWLLAGEHPLTRDQVRRATETVTVASRATTRIDPGFDAAGAPRSQTALLWLLVSVAVTVGSTVFATGLVAAEARAETSLLTLLGARPAVLRRLRAIQALIVAGLGACAGTLLGITPSLLVWARRGGDYVLVIPWPVLGAVAFGLPLLAVTVVSVPIRIGRIGARRQRPLAVPNGVA